MAKNAAKKNVVEAPGTVMGSEELLVMPCAQAAVAIHDWASHFPVNDLSELVRQIHVVTEKVVKDGDMHPLEAMLTGQAIALQNLFTNLTRRAAKQEYLKQQTAYLTLGLKAQAQCRATIEALGELRNPRQVAFVKQANIAQQQQVNNGGPRTENNADVRNELLEAPDESRLVPRATGAASGGDQKLATLVEVHRTDDTGR